MKEEEDDDEKLINNENDNNNNIINTNNNQNKEKNSMKSSLNKNSSENENLIIKQKENSIMDEFVDFYDDNNFYHNLLLTEAKNKVWKIVKKLKKNPNYYKNYDPFKLKWYIINPDKSKYYKVFKIFVLILLFIDFFLSPFEYYVSDYDYRWVRFLFFDLIFTIEIILKMLTSYYDSNLKLYVTDIKKIFFHRKFSIIINSLYVIPFYIFNRDFQLFRLLKVYRYPRVNQNNKKFLFYLLSIFTHNLTIKIQTINVFAFFISLIYILHFCACYYAYLGIKYTDSWVYSKKISYNLSLNTKDIYISSLYFLAETFTSTGYGDLTPNNLIEYYFIMFCEILNCGLYAYLLSNILEILTNKENSLSYKYRNDQINLQEWIIYYMNKLPASSKKDNLHRNKIWSKVKTYFDIYYSTEKNFKWIDKNNFIKQFKPLDRKKFLNHVFDKILNKFPNFFKCLKNDSSKFDVIINFKTHIEEENTEIIKINKDIKRIYFIDQGKISVFDDLNQNVVTLEEGDFFGLEYFINKDSKSKFTYKVTNKSKFALLFSIKIDFFIKNILNYDGESFLKLIEVSKLFCVSKLKEENIDLDVNNNEIDMNVNENLMLNYNLNKIGILPKLIEEKNKLLNENIILDECNERIDLIQNQIQFSNKYLSVVLNSKKN